MEPNNDQQVTVFAQTNFRHRIRRFGILKDDRRRHMYIIGKTGMGKTTMIENMIISDIYAGRGVAVVDPHGDFADTIIAHIPTHRVNDVIHFSPPDTNYPIGFNILEEINPEYRHLVANGLVSVFKKIWADSWGPRLEYILMNTILALIEYPGSTLLGVLRMLVDKNYRKKVVNNLRDPMVRSFWENEYANYNDKFRSEAIAPIQNKVGQFLSSSIIRNIVGQPKSTINIRDIMDHQKILIMNLSKGRIGEENSALLGAMMITKIQLAAMSRADIPEEERKDFYLYVDEFQNFATESFADILSEARKYRLNLIMAHQYIEQLEEEVAAAVFGNVGTLVVFRVGAADAEILEKEFEPHFMIPDLVNIAKFQIYLKLMINGVASHPFSAMTLPPLQHPTGNAEKVIAVSRERYARSKEIVEERILRWSGLSQQATAQQEAAEGAESLAASPAARPATSASAPQRITVLPPPPPIRVVPPVSQQAASQPVPAPGPNISKGTDFLSLNNGELLPRTDTSIAAAPETSDLSLSEPPAASDAVPQKQVAMPSPTPVESAPQASGNTGSFSAPGEISLREAIKQDQEERPAKRRRRRRRGRRQPGQSPGPESSSPSAPPASPSLTPPSQGVNQ